MKCVNLNKFMSGTVTTLELLYWVDKICMKAIKAILVR
jgi:hypothetical protein